MKTEDVTKVTPSPTRVLVRLATPEDTHAGTSIVNINREPTNFGLVLAVGTDVVDIEPGNVVIVNKWNQGANLEVPKDHVLLYDQNDILATIEGLNG